jgi:hypothetical protein
LIRNGVWGVDGTGKTDEQGQQHFLLGVIDHGTRCCLDLQALKDKRAPFWHQDHHGVGKSNQGGVNGSLEHRDGQLCSA